MGGHCVTVNNMSIHPCTQEERTERQEVSWTSSLPVGSTQEGRVILKQLQEACVCESIAGKEGRETEGEKLGQGFAG